MNCKSQKMCVALWISCLVTAVHLNIQHNRLPTSQGQLTTVWANFPNSASWLPCSEYNSISITVTSIRLHWMDRVEAVRNESPRLVNSYKHCMGSVKPSLVEWNRALHSASVRAVLDFVLTRSASWVKIPSARLCLVKFSCNTNIPLNSTWHRA